MDFARTLDRIMSDGKASRDCVVFSLLRGQCRWSARLLSACLGTWDAEYRVAILEVLAGR
jgi:hypothetical protein